MAPHTVRRALLVLVACFIIAIAAPLAVHSSAAAADSPIIVRLTVDNPPGTQRAAGEQHFADLVEKMSNGRMKVQIFWSGSLGGSQRAALDTVRAGGAEIAAISSSNFAAIDRTWGLFDMPFLFTGPDGLYKYIDSPEFQALKAETVRKDGVRYIFPWYDTWRQLVTTKRPVHSPDQMNGIKLRTTGSPVETAYSSALGAKPVSVDWGETYLALKNGLVDGYFISYTAVTNFKQDDAVKYGTTLNIVPIVVPMFMAESFYQKLPADLRKVLDEAGRQADLNDRQLDLQNNTESIKKLQGEGFVIYGPTAAEKAEWVSKVKPVYGQFDSTFPAGAITKILAQQRT